MTYPATNFNEAVNLVVPDSNALHKVINGGTEETVLLPEGDSVPTLRKAIADSLLFKDPIAWSEGNNETNFLQLRTFTDGLIYWAPTATETNQIPMGITPVGDTNWKLAPVTVRVVSVNGKDDIVVLDASDFDDIYSKTEVDNALSSKANSSDVYLKTETYSQTEIDDALSSKANSSDVYQKTETYSQEEIDSALSNLEQSISYQTPAYDPDTVYSYGDVVYKTIGGVKKFFQWYSNVESLAGKDPELDGNRQTGWIDDTKPFYWTPLKGSRPGTPLWPWMSMTFPEGTLNVVGNSVPKAVFWRLAEAFPEFINGDYIDFPETGGEFFRVLDQGRGVDVGRTFNSYQKATITAWNTGSDEAVYSLNLTQSSSGLSVIGADQIDTAEYQPANLVGIVSSGAISLPGTVNGGYAGSVRPRNLAFPILVEV